MRIPLMCGERCVGLLDLAAAERIARAPNARPVCRRRGRQLVEIQLEPFSDDSGLKARRGNPLVYSYDSESTENVQNVWALKRVGDTGSIFRQVLTDCLK